MSFAKAFEKATAKKGETIDMPQQAQSVESDPERVPMMYRAQISGRCSLMFAGDNNQDLNDWTQEWVFPIENGEPNYQHEQPKLGLDGSVYRFEIEFPFRVCSNCGQDSILRPVIGKHGIPFIPGSSIKGIFRRLLFSNEISAEKKQRVAKYSGNEEHPGILRFHGAYLVGDWAGTEKVTDKIRYRMVDVIHPQEKPQVQGKGSATALAMVSFYQPKMVFEISCIEPLSETEWESVKGLLRTALRLGLGGKTSTGYGLWVLPKNTYSLSVTLKGVGVSSLLRSGQPEFRPNLFKATLRGHVNRWLAGVCSTETIIEARVKQLFGSTKAPSQVQIYWETKKSSNKPILEYDIQGTEGTPIYKIEGNLYVDAPKQDLKFLALVLQFAYIMGGFGKSWRRVWHKCSIKDWHHGFLSTYQTRAIGCHWEGYFIESKDFEPIQIANSDDLAKFLSELHNECRKYMKIQQAQFCAWKEAWHPDRVLVYSNVVRESKIVRLFHEEQFKTVTAVGGRKKIKNTGEVEKEVLVHSSVWHRMLPLPDNKYLEIVTVFHGDRTPWKREEKDPSTGKLKQKDQLLSFITGIKSALGTNSLTWGNEPNT
ncbi:MAG: RAMP superfamily CRISPR-associated protein [Phormidium sp.]